MARPRFLSDVIANIFPDRFCLHLLADHGCSWLDIELIRRCISDIVPPM